MIRIKKNLTANLQYFHGLCQLWLFTCSVMHIGLLPELTEYISLHFRITISVANHHDDYDYCLYVYVHSLLTTEFSFLKQGDCGSAIDDLIQAYKLPKSFGTPGPISNCHKSVYNKCMCLPKRRIICIVRRAADVKRFTLTIWSKWQSLNGEDIFCLPPSFL